MNRPPKDLDAFEKSLVAESGDALDLLRSQRAGCPPLEVLRAASVGALPEPQQSDVCAHLAACGSCRSLQADLEAIESADATPKEVERILAGTHRDSIRSETVRSKRFRILWWPAAAAVALLLFAVFVTRRLQPPQQSGPSVPLAAETKPVMPAPIPPALRLEKPPLHVSLAALTWRNNKSKRASFLNDLSPALKAYRANDYVQAARGLEALSRNYPDSVEVFYYLGVCRLFLSDFSAASEALERAARLADGSFTADVMWYISISYHRSGNLETARSHLQQLCGGSSGYAERACEALKELDSPAASPSR